MPDAQPRARRRVPALTLVVLLAWRSLWRHRQRTIIAVSSIALGLAFALFFIAFAEGMYAQLIGDTVRTQMGHLALERPGYRATPGADLWIDVPDTLAADIAALDDVERVKRLVVGQGMARSGAGSIGVVVAGVEPAVEAQVSPLPAHMLAGTYLSGSAKATAVIGTELARRLDLDVGKKLVLTANDADGNLVDELCRVAGIFETGSDEIDGYLVQIPIGLARQTFGLPAHAVTQLAVILSRPEAQRRVAASLTRLVDGRPVAVRSWQEILPEVDAYIRLDRGSNWIFQVLLIVMILFTIFNTILMSVLERRREFAMQLALGTAPRQLELQVFVEAIGIGLMGCVLGMALGGAAAGALQQWGLDLRWLYSGDLSISGFALSPILHARVTAWILLAPTLLVFCAIVIVSLVPMRQVLKVRIVDWLD